MEKGSAFMNFCNELEKMRMEAINYSPMSILDPLKTNLEIERSLLDLMLVNFNNYYEKMFCVCNNNDYLFVDKPKYVKQTFGQNLSQLSNYNAECPQNSIPIEKISDLNEYISNNKDPEVLNSSVNISISKVDRASSLPNFRNISSEWAQNGLELRGSDDSKNQTNVRPRKKRNIMSFTMKRINNDASKPNEHSVGDSPTSISSFACRADVIYKKILRDFRRYYINNFNEITGYKDSKRGKGKEFALQLLYKYVDTVFGQDMKNKDDIVFTLGSLIFPNNFCKTSLGKKKKSKKEISKIHDTLYKFSISKVDKLLEDKYVGYLMHYFLDQTENTRELISQSKVSEESYITAFNLIRSRVQNAVNELNSK